MSGGIRFDRSTVTVRGDIVNIEGDQINIASGPASDVLRAIVHAVRSASSSDELADVLQQLELGVAARDDIATDDVAAAVEREVRELPKSRRQTLRAFTRQIGAGVTSGVIVQGVVLGVRAALGV
jgi:hypothetical protein